jgi:hypothetical protein
MLRRSCPIPLHAVKLPPPSKRRAAVALEARAGVIQYTFLSHVMLSDPGPVKWWLSCCALTVFVSSNTLRMKVVLNPRPTLSHPPTAPPPEYAPTLCRCGARIRLLVAVLLLPQWKYIPMSPVRAITLLSSTAPAKASSTYSPTEASAEERGEEGACWAEVAGTGELSQQIKSTSRG